MSSNGLHRWHECGFQERNGRRCDSSSDRRSFYRSNISVNEEAVSDDGGNEKCRDGKDKEIDAKREHARSRPMEHRL
jgi:hypothetical protein